MAPPSALGKVFGWNNSVQNVARVVGPMAFTPLYTASKTSIFYIGAGLTLFNCMVVLFVSRSRAKPRSGAPQDEEGEADAALPELQQTLMRMTSTASSCKTFGNPC